MFNIEGMEWLTLCFFTSLEGSNDKKEYMSYSQRKYFYLVPRMPIAPENLKSEKATNKVMCSFGDIFSIKITKKFLSVDEICYFVNWQSSLPIYIFNWKTSEIVC